MKQQLTDAGHGKHDRMRREKTAQDSDAHRHHLRAESKPMSSHPETEEEAAHSDHLLAQAGELPKTKRKLIASVGGEDLDRDATSNRDDLRDKAA